jgi:hypothetical protein
LTVKVTGRRVQKKYTMQNNKHLSGETKPGHCILTHICTEEEYKSAFQKQEIRISAELVSTNGKYEHSIRAYSDKGGSAVELATSLISRDDAFQEMRARLLHREIFHIGKKRIRLGEGSILTIEVVN